MYIVRWLFDPACEQCTEDIIVSFGTAMGAHFDSKIIRTE